MDSLKLLHVNDVVNVTELNMFGKVVNILPFQTDTYYEILFNETIQDVTYRGIYSRNMLTLIESNEDDYKFNIGDKVQFKLQGNHGIVFNRDRCFSDGNTKTNIYKVGSLSSDSGNWFVEQLLISVKVTTPSIEG